MRGRLSPGCGRLAAFLAICRPWVLPAGVVVALASACSDHGARLGYHEIKVDSAGLIVPWYVNDPGVAYDHNIILVWNWWKRLGPCPNGVPYYLQHQVWKPAHDPRGVGGDQFAMILSSWRLLYAYTGDTTIVENMVLISDYYLDHSLSSPSALWPHLPYPYNTAVHSGVYDGDMAAGVGFTQPDKAGSFASELVGLYELTGRSRYLAAAVAIADTLAARIAPGDAAHSPWPFRVHAGTGRVRDPYTTNYAATLSLFDELIRLKRGDAPAYVAARNTLTAWLRNHPLQTNKWGPFFEDVGRYSDTEINADSLAAYILEHPEWGPTWQTDARAILDWSRATFGDARWARYGATAIDEQSAYMAPGASHTARHWSVELLYAEKTGDGSRKAEAIRGLNWATYTVDDDGKNRYPGDDIWLTDGYGDYVQHYLRAMAAAPELAPPGRNCLLRSSSVVTLIRYAADGVQYTTYDSAASEVLRVGFTPAGVQAGGESLARLERASLLGSRQGYTFDAPGDAPGTLRIRHDRAVRVRIDASAATRAAPASALTLHGPNRLIQHEMRSAGGGEAPQMK